MTGKIRIKQEGGTRYKGCGYIMRQGELAERKEEKTARRGYYHRVVDRKGKQAARRRNPVSVGYPHVSMPLLPPTVDGCSTSAGANLSAAAILQSQPRWAQQGRRAFSAFSPSRPVTGLNEPLEISGRSKRLTTRCGDRWKEGSCGRGVP